MCCEEREGGVDLPLLFLSHLEVTQASSLHTPQLAKTEKESQEQSTEGEKGLNSPARCSIWSRKPSVLYTVYGQRWWKALERSRKRCLKISELFWDWKTCFFYGKWILNLFCQNNKILQEKCFWKAVCDLCCQIDSPLYVECKKVEMNANRTTIDCRVLVM